MPKEVEMKPIEVEMKMKPRNGNETKLKPIKVEMKIYVALYFVINFFYFMESSSVV
jgi:hypothetical protein